MGGVSEFYAYKLWCVEAGLDPESKNSCKGWNELTLEKRDEVRASINKILIDHINALSNAEKN